MRIHKILLSHNINIPPACQNQRYLLDNLHCIRHHGFPPTIPSAQPPCPAPATAGAIIEGGPAGERSEEGSADVAASPRRLPRFEDRSSGFFPADEEPELDGTQVVTSFPFDDSVDTAAVAAAAGATAEPPLAARLTPDHSLLSAAAIASLPRAAAAQDCLRRLEEDELDLEGFFAAAEPGTRRTLNGLTRAR